MENYEQRLQELEKRIYNMEVRQAKMQMKLEGKNEAVYDIRPVIKPVFTPEVKPEVNYQTKKEHNPSLEAELEPITYYAPTANKKKLSEDIIGKYLIGGLASILIFIAAISLIGLIWIMLSPGARVSIIGIIGLMLAGLGFYLSNKKNNYISSTILGTGAGLIYISIAFAYFSLGLMNSGITILIILIWAIFLIIMSKIIDMFYTSIIAYIGAYLTIILALRDMEKSFELLFIILFALIIFAAMFVVNKEDNKKVKLVTILGLVSFYTISTYTYLDGLTIYNGAKFMKLGVLLPISTLVITYLLSNLIYKIYKNSKQIYVQGIVGVLTTIVTILYLEVYNTNLSDFMFEEFLLIILLLQLIIILSFYNNIREIAIYFYISVIGLTIMYLFDKNIDFFGGIVFVVIFLILLEQLFKLKTHEVFIGVLLIIDTFLCLNANSSIIFVVTQCLQIASILYILFYKHHKQEYKKINFIKTSVMMIVLINIYSILYNINSIYKLEKPDLFLTISYIIATIVIIGSILIGFYKDWQEESFELFANNYHLEDDKNISKLLHIIIIIIYAIGMINVHNVKSNLARFIILIVTMVMALIQSYILLDKNKSNESKNYIGIWIGIKYLFFTWNTLLAYRYLRIHTMVYSLTGLVLAFIAIYIGFKIKVKSLRIFGLILTITMVLKFILIDLTWYNSLMRVFSFVIAGLLCFGISILYNKISIEKND